MSYTLSFKPAIGLYGQHDPSAALFEDGEPVYAVEEERFTRRKHAVETFPTNAIEACLDHRTLDLSDVDQILLPYDPELRSAILPHYVRNAARASGVVRKLHRIQQTAIRETQAQLYPVRQIRSLLSEIGTPVPPIETRAHHACHAASAFHPSGFEEALVLTIDAKGEYDSTVVWYGTPDGLERVRTYEHPNSLGIFFAIVTEYLGYRMFDGEGKVMGLAPYGSENHDIERALAEVVDDGVDYDVTGLTGGWGTGHGLARLEDVFDRPQSGEPGEFSQWEKDLAYTAQRFLERTVVDIAETYCDELDTGNVALAGGVALNCKANRQLIESDHVDAVFVQPVAHDAGLSLGAGWLDRSPADVHVQDHVYWGPEYTTREVRELLEATKVEYLEPDDVAQYTAERLAEGALVGWFQGRLELGPRALGHRSILADPRTVDSRDRVNRFVKHREEWRPFAPSILASATSRYLDTGRPDPFMITTATVPSERRDEISAVLHPADGTTRPQTVDRETAPRYHRLISEFDDRTGIPAVLNTSFNDHGEPIVENPTQALKDFYGMGLDVLVMEDLVVEK